MDPQSVWGHERQHLCRRTPTRRPADLALSSSRARPPSIERRLPLLIIVSASTHGLRTGSALADVRTVEAGERRLAALRAWRATGMLDGAWHLRLRKRAHTLARSAGGRVHASERAVSLRSSASFIARHISSNRTELMRCARTRTSLGVGSGSSPILSTLGLKGMSAAALGRILLGRSPTPQPPE